MFVRFGLMFTGCWWIFACLFVGCLVDVCWIWVAFFAGCWLIFFDFCRILGEVCWIRVCVFTGCWCIFPGFLQEFGRCLLDVGGFLLDVG